MTHKSWPVGRMPYQLMNRIYGPGKGSCQGCVHLDEIETLAAKPEHICTFGAQTGSSKPVKWDPSWPACEKKEAP